MEEINTRQCNRIGNRPSSDLLSYRRQYQSEEGSMDYVVFMGNRHQWKSILMEDKQHRGENIQLKEIDQQSK